jgi:hypothetical protein
MTKPNAKYKYIEIQWQLGNPTEVGVNGCQIEDVIEFCMDKFTKLEEEVPCVQNRFVITKLAECMHALKNRQGDRKVRGVLGTTNV